MTYEPLNPSWHGSSGPPEPALCRERCPGQVYPCEGGGRTMTVLSQESVVSAVGIKSRSLRPPPKSGPFNDGGRVPETPRLRSDGYPHRAPPPAIAQPRNQAEARPAATPDYR